MKNYLLKFSYLLFLFFPFSQSSAFVENVTHGYVNCMACHVSPSGGGLLNDYGRSLSRELMSTWSWENSEKPLFGAIENKKWFQIGGDFRFIQTYLENSQIKQGRQFQMQSNIELGFFFSKIAVIGTLGTQEGPKSIPDKGKFLSERHYILWNLTDENKLRFGKFRLNFGISDSNHTRLTKQTLGFGSNSESYILEFTNFSDTEEISISADLGRLDQNLEKSRERSISFNIAHYISEKSKIGSSFLFGESDQQRRSLLGIYGISGFFQNFVLKAEVDYQQSTSNKDQTTNNKLVAASANFGYQATKGLMPYLIAENSLSTSKNSTSQQSNTGFGVQWLPIPHIEIQAEYIKQISNSQQILQTDFAWLLFHFYI